MVLTLFKFFTALQKNIKNRKIMRQIHTIFQKIVACGIIFNIELKNIIIMNERITDKQELNPATAQFHLLCI